MKLAFVIDPIADLDPTHDTSVALMESAQAAGHEVWVTQMMDLSASGREARARLQPLRLTPVSLVEAHWVAAARWFDTGEAVARPLAEFDAIFVRTDPPVDATYLYGTQILDLLDPKHTLVVNSPRGLQAANEKLYALNFPEVVPTTIVAADKATIRGFVAGQGQAVLKPLDGKGGEGILFLADGDRNFHSMVEVSTRRGRVPVMVQQFLPEAKSGDKRVILLAGEPIGAVNRVPSGEDFRGNMAVGGSVERAEMTDRDREIAAAVAPQLLADGLYFVGLDVIGGYLTEVNVTSPTGIREIDRLNSVRLGDRVISWLERYLEGR
ncbi:glutathione synthetase, prokaryotic [Rubidibacter lacunae KORDI 51-2]|uniref:Glutathione synthetase n=1 Tax=Rubidibacter lacunae KORDI 51-2 TaxID=582515 RepID=U5DFI5_9CHRO|nr:glutathione synthase [Rubidibacter lacunae]ERN40361.1 glutathione synthetase, prokaryotic [Rubidibacter lacunae KORDI 51-2]